MSPFTILVLCVQACLIQSVLSQLSCGCSSGMGGYSNTVPLVSTGSYGNNLISTGKYGSNIGIGSSCGCYGGQGIGTVSADGCIDACGTTCVVGSVPVLGSVTFSGCTPACGSVSISGQCGCGCQGVSSGIF